MLVLCEILKDDKLIGVCINDVQRTIFMDHHFASVKTL